MMAVRSLIGLFRKVYPELLERKDRGKVVAVTKKNNVPEYGQVKVADTIEGLADKSEESDVDPGEGWEGWELCSDQEEEDDQEGSPKKQKLLTKSAATTSILTDEDFKAIRLQKAKKEAEEELGIVESEDSDYKEEFMDADDMQFGLKRKRDYEARLESIKAGREGREKFGSAKNKKDRPGSTTNKQKQKSKSFLMMKQKKSIKGKAKRSLREKRTILREHVRKQKMKI